MIEILISLAVLASLTPIVLAKHRGRRRSRLFVPRIDGQVAIGALATKDMTSTPLAQVLDNEMWALSIDITASISDVTANEGPIVIGVAHSDYTAAEIEEWLEGVSSWITADKIRQEQSRRKIRQIGVFDCTETAERLNDGRVLRVKLGFKLEDGTTLQFWAYNDGAAVMTTGALVSIKGKAFLRPM